jgi:hypothetical protein
VGGHLWLILGVGQGPEISPGGLKKFPENTGGQSLTYSTHSTVWSGQFWEQEPLRKNAFRLRMTFTLRMLLKICSQLFTGAISTSKVR